MARRIQLRRDTAANWVSSNPTLAQGEVGVDITNNKIKIGNGTQNWNSLAYFDDKETVLSNYAGNIIPSTDDTYTLGTPDKRWKDVFVTEGSIYIGDVKLSNSNGTLVINRVTDAGLVSEDVVEGGADAVQVDLTGYATEEYVNNAVGAIEIPDVSNFITAEDIPAIPADISDLTDTEGLLGQGGSSTTELAYLELTNNPFIVQPAELGDPVEFTRTAEDSETDSIDTGLTIARGSNGALYNTESELEYDRDNHTSPAGTEWNSDGWGDLLNLHARGYTTFRAALGNNIGENIIGAELIMHDTINDRYYKFSFSDWGVNNDGTIAGFGTATIAGETYVSGSPLLAVIAYGIYVDSVIVAHSRRGQTQTRAQSGWPMTTQAIITVAAGQTVDVRTKVTLSSFRIGPSMSLILLPVTI